MLDHAIIDELFSIDLPEPDYFEDLYPPRQLPDHSEVTRFGPSPTGHVHIGNIYAAMIDESVAHQNGGTYLVRIEDTDQARVVEGAESVLERAFKSFGIHADEGPIAGSYGPYYQSQREMIYLTYARQLLRQGSAYICFAAENELNEIRKRQEAAKLPTGYYGRWATWRDASDDAVRAKLAEAAPYVVRFRAPEISTHRARFTDRIRGPLEHEDNRNDAVILKTSMSNPRLPTYHFAHAIDDHLMRITLVIRGEEWISSVPLHLQLFDALGFDRIDYAHIAPLMTQQGGNKRKLSKRKDPEASVDFYLAAGYPPRAVLYYLRGLANGRLADLPIDEALAEPIRLDECGVSGPLVDTVKLADIGSDLIATMTADEVLDAVLAWAREYDIELVAVLDAERDLARRAVDVERVDATGAPVENPRKDLFRWADFRQVYGFFLTGLFEPVTDAADERFGAVPADAVRSFAAAFADAYAEHDEQPVWFAQIRELATAQGFAPSPKDYKRDPDAYPGALRDAANIVRVALTGSSRSPDLHAVAQALGRDEVLRRVRAVG